MMTPSQLNDPMICFRAVRGFDKQESFELLTALLAEYGGKTLSKMLYCNMFISESYYNKLVKVGRA
jgi:hypothetical protein